jgi:hypothetical protein
LTIEDGAEYRLLGGEAGSPRKFLKSFVNLHPRTNLTIKEGTDFQKAKLPKIFKISREFSSRNESDNRGNWILLGEEAPENF